MQEFDSLEHRDTASSNANKFNLAIDEENIDFNISGVPNAMVKRSHDINVHNLIQQIENHPQRQALQSDLQHHRAFNPFSEESKDAIKAAGNTELCEIVDVEPKSQCRACLTYWNVGIVYCTCGHFLEDDTTENKKYISSVLDLFSIPNFYIRKGRPQPCWNWVALKELFVRWTNWRTKTTPILPQKKNSTCIVAIGGYVQILWVPKRCR